VLESYVTKRRDRMAALKFLRKTMKRFGQPNVIVTDKLRSYGAAMKVIGNADRQETGRWLNNRAENSHLPFRRRERAMLRFRRMRSLQKFVAFMPQSTTISTRPAATTPAQISRSTVPLLLPVGANLARSLTYPCALHLNALSVITDLAVIFVMSERPLPECAQL